MSIWRCPTCDRRGEVVQSAPVMIRRCAKGHKWLAKPFNRRLGYIPLGVRLENAQSAIVRLRAALYRASLLLKEAHHELSPTKQATMRLSGEAHQLDLLLKEVDSILPK